MRLNLLAIFIDIKSVSNKKNDSLRKKCKLPEKCKYSGMPKSESLKTGKRQNRNF